MGRLQRILKHVFAWPAGFSRAWPAASVRTIEQSISAGERRHRAELRFCVEESLPWSYLWRHASARERAVNLFGKLRVWDTEENTGVLIYVLHADRRVEIVADRAAARAITQAQWDAWVGQLQAAYRAGRFEAGTIEVLAAINEALAQHFPARESNPNELADAPVIIRR
ncbi:MAG TPA: TPM domain-containing protein [Burkholderiaceae bacterium]|nr:TPM domain-containing protein [Burkholderiaceae bacterium]